MSVEFTGKKACIAPEGVFIIGTYDENGVPNAMNAAWGAQSDFDEITPVPGQAQNHGEHKAYQGFYRSLCH